MRKGYRSSVTRKEHDLIGQARADHRHDGWKAAPGILALVMALSILAALLLGLGALHTCADVVVGIDLDLRHPSFVMQIHHQGPECQDDGWSSSSAQARR
jgi:hypothetical protein